MAKYDLKTFARAWTCAEPPAVDEYDQFFQIYVEGRAEPIQLSDPMPVRCAPAAGDRVVELAGSYVWMTPAEFDAAFEPAE